MTSPERYSMTRKSEPIDALVVAEQERSGRLVELLPELRQGAVLAAHVVGPRGELPERWAPHDEWPLAELDEVRQVGRTVGELEHLEVAVELGKVGPQVVLERGPIELLAGSDRRDLRRLGRHQRVRTVQALIPGAP